MPMGMRNAHNQRNQGCCQHDSKDNKAWGWGCRGITHRNVEKITPPAYAPHKCCMQAGLIPKRASLYGPQHNAGGQTSNKLHTQHTRTRENT